jgi:hypothetical protein
VNTAFVANGRQAHFRQNGDVMHAVKWNCMLKSTEGAVQHSANNVIVDFQQMQQQRQAIERDFVTLSDANMSRSQNRR